MALANKMLNQFMVSTTDKPLSASGGLWVDVQPAGSEPSDFVRYETKPIYPQKPIAPTLFKNYSIYKDESQIEINNLIFNYLINNAVNLGNKDIDLAIDFIFENVNLLLKKKKFEICKELLEYIPVKDLSVDILLSFLTITLPASSILKQSRINFYNKVKEELKSRNIDDYEVLLIGLGYEIL